MGQLELVKLLKDLMEGTWKEHSRMRKGLCFSSTADAPSLGVVVDRLHMKAEGNGQKAMERVLEQSGTTFFCWKFWKISWQVGKFSLTQNSPLHAQLA